MVARENFGPRVAQVAAVALLIDYIVTVAVQTAAGSPAILSTFPALAKPLGETTTLLIIAVGVHLLMCYGNLRGVREAGRTFALPTYLFSGVGRPDDPGRPVPRGRSAACRTSPGDSGTVTLAAPPERRCSPSAPSTSWRARSPTAAPR